MSSVTGKHSSQHGGFGGLSPRHAGRSQLDRPHPALQGAGPPFSIGPQGSSEALGLPGQGGTLRPTLANLAGRGCSARPSPEGPLWCRRPQDWTPIDLSHCAHSGVTCLCFLSALFPPSLACPPFPPLSTSLPETAPYLLPSERRFCGRNEPQGPTPVPRHGFLTWEQTPPHTPPRRTHRQPAPFLGGLSTKLWAILDKQRFVAPSHVCSPALGGLSMCWLIQFSPQPCDVGSILPPLQIVRQKLGEKSPAQTFSNITPKVPQSDRRPIPPSPLLSLSTHHLPLRAFFGQRKVSLEPPTSGLF